MFILVVDAMAKIPEALLDSKLHWPGSFHCVSYNLFI